MMNHLIEIIFKNISDDKIGKLLRDLTSRGEEIVNYNFTCGVSKVNWNSEQSIEVIFKKNKNFGLFVNLKILKKARACIPQCGISIYKNETAINLEINFQLLDLGEPLNEQLTEKLMELAKNIATQYEIQEYYCGLEPAEEEKTRLFTNQQVGPFSISE